MICPQCGSEFRPGFYKCSDCGIALVAPVESPSPFHPPDDSDLDLVTVFESDNPALIALARSLLDSAGILFTTPGGHTKQIFGKHNPFIGPVKFQVNREDATDARLLLEDLKENGGEELSAEED